MSTTSADPAKLKAFIDGVKAARRSAETTQASVASLSASTIAACEGYVSVPALAALATLLDNMGENELFVQTVREELLAADNHDGGPITISDASLAAALRAKGVGTPPPPVLFDPVSIVGIPQTSGFVDDPICAANGNMIHQDTDVEFPAIAGTLNIVRTYNSVVSDRPGVFGAGWSSALDMVLEQLDDRIKVQLPDGAVITFVVSADGDWQTDSRRMQGLDETADGFVADLDHERRLTFDANGLLTGWEAGVATVAVTRSESRITSLTEQFSGRRIDVEWDGDLIAALASSDGRRVTYARDESSRITDVSTFAGGLSYSWDANLLLSVVDRDGVALFVNVYDDGGRVIEQTSPFGRVTTYTYQIPGATVIADERGVRQAMVHDGRGNLTAVIDVDGSAMRITYDDADRAVRVVSKFGAEWRYDFDQVTGDLLTRHDPDGLQQSWTWDELGRPLTDTDRDGAVTTFEYSGDHRTPVRVVGPDGSVATSEIGDAGRPVTITDADGVIRRLQWDRDGQLTKITDASGAETTFEFDAAGLLVRLVDPAGVDTRLEYEGGRVARSERGDAVSTYQRTDGGRIRGGTEPGDLPWSATFGSHGAMESITDAVGSTARYEYDSLGDVTAVIAPDGATYRSEYNEIGLLIAATDPTGATLRKGYDVEGRLVEFVDPEGGVMRRELDVLGRTERSVAPDGAVTAWTYHPNGEIASVTSPDGRVWTTEIDVFGRLTAVIDPMGGRATRTYSPAGRLTSRTSPAGRRETFEYDEAGRCVAMVGVDGIRRQMHLDERGQVTAVDTVFADGDTTGQDASAEARVEMIWDEHRRMAGFRTESGETRFERDPAGRLLSAVDPTGVSTRFDWDERGLLRSATDAAGGTSSYTYDERGRVVAQTMPGGRTTSWAYDLGGRVASTIDPMGVTTDVIRNGSGTVTGVRRAGGGWDRTLDAVGREIERTALDGSVLGQYTYDAAGRMTAAVAPDTGLFTEFLWDDADRITQITDSTGTSTIERDADGRTVAFTNQSGIRTVVERDASGRVIGVVDGDAGPFRLPASEVVRDPAGRLLIGSDGTVYRYDDSGRLAEVAPADGTSTTYEYGDDGLVAREIGPSGTRGFAYDAAGRVDSITVEGRGTTNVEYDAAGRRSMEVDPDGTVTEYRWNAIDQLVEIRRTTAIGETTAIRIDLDALGRPQRINDQVIGYDPVSGRPNLVGEVRIVNAGAISWRSDDGLWGRTRQDQPDGLHIGGMALLGARVYDPRSRQFLSADPLLTVPGSNGGASAYTYAWQDPVNFVDPTGLRPVSQEEYDAIRKSEEQGSLNKAWEAIKEDPWGTVAMVGVVAVGVGLLFVPGGQVIGAGILIGAATSAGVGLATGSFDPRQVALGGIVGGISGGIGAATTSTTTAIITNGALSGASDLASQGLSGQPIDWGSVGVNTLVGGVTGGLGSHLKPYIKTGTHAVVSGAVTEGAADYTKQVLTGDGPVNWNQVAVSAGGGGVSGGMGHHFSQEPATLGDPSHTAFSSGDQHGGGSSPDNMTVYRGTRFGNEIQIQGDTGLMMSDAGRAAYMESGGDVDVAQQYSDAAHDRAVQTWGSEGDYVEAHSAFPDDIADVSGRRTMVSVTTDPDRAAYFAGKEGVVYRGEVPRDSLLPQTLAGANEGEYLARTSIKMDPIGPGS